MLHYITTPRRVYRACRQVLLGLFLVNSCLAGARVLPAGESDSPTHTTNKSESLLELPNVPQQTPHPLTLIDAVTTALSKNHGIQAELIAVDIKETDVMKERGTFDPKATLSVGEQRNDAVDATGKTTRSESLRGSVGVSKRFLTGTELALSYETADSRKATETGRYESKAKVTLSQDILKSFGLGTNRAKLRIAQSGVDRASATFADKTIGIIADVQNAYWELYKSDATLAIRARSYDLTRDLLAKKRMEAKLGHIATVELIGVESEVASRIADYTRALKEYKVSEVNLRSLLAMPVTPGAVGERLKPTTAPSIKAEPIDVDAIVNSMLLTHKGYASLLLEREAKEIELDYLRNQLLPSIKVKGSYGLQNKGAHWTEADARLDAGDSYELGLELSFPFGNRSARADRNKAVLELKQIDARLFQKEDEIRKGIQVALIDVEQAALLMKVGETNVVLKEKNLNAVTTKMQMGNGSLRDVLDRQKDLIDAELQLIEAQVGYQKARVGLYKAQGVIVPELPIELPEAWAILE